MAVIIGNRELFYDIHHATIVAEPASPDWVYFELNPGDFLQLSEWEKLWSEHCAPE